MRFLALASIFVALFSIIWKQEFQYGAHWPRLYKMWTASPKSQNKENKKVQMQQSYFKDVPLVFRCFHFFVFYILLSNLSKNNQQINSEEHIVFLTQQFSLSQYCVQFRLPTNKVWHYFCPLVNNSFRQSVWPDASHAVRLCVCL